LYITKMVICNFFPILVYCLTDNLATLPPGRKVLQCCCLWHNMKCNCEFEDFFTESCNLLRNIQRRLACEAVEN
jgi:hypothetical protein